MIMFRRELKDNVKNEIMRDGRDYESLAEFIEIVIDLNDKLYERVMKKWYDQFKDRAELIYESAAEYAKSKQQSYIRNSEYTESAFMKLKMTHQRRKKNSKSKKKDKEKKLCYECEKTGHFVKNCRNESVMSQRQLNVTLKKYLKLMTQRRLIIRQRFWKSARTTNTVLSTVWRNYKKLSMQHQRNELTKESRNSDVHRHLIQTALKQCLSQI